MLLVLTGRISTVDMNIINLTTPIVARHTVVKLMIFMTTVKILLVRTDIMWRSHQSPIFYWGRARQTIPNTAFSHDW
jgi:hypothetical protein